MPLLYTAATTSKPIAFYEVPCLGLSPKEMLGCYACLFVAFKGISHPAPWSYFDFQWLDALTWHSSTVDYLKQNSPEGRQYLNALQRTMDIATEQAFLRNDKP
jgi:hypothetical protein